MVAPLADWLTSPRIVSSRELICPKALSAVEIIWLADWLLATACLVLMMSPLSASAAIKPDGLSAPELICKPVLSWVSDVCNCAFELARVCWAFNELMLVLIRVMPYTPMKKVYVQASPDYGEITIPDQLAARRSAVVCLAVRRATGMKKRWDPPRFVLRETCLGPRLSSRPNRFRLLATETTCSYTTRSWSPGQPTNTSRTSCPSATTLSRTVPLGHTLSRSIGMIRYSL